MTRATRGQRLLDLVAPPNPRGFRRYVAGLLLLTFGVLLGVAEHALGGI